MSKLKKFWEWVKPAPSMAKFGMLMFVISAINSILSIFVGGFPVAELAMMAFFGLTVLYHFLDERYENLKKENTELKNTIDTLSSVISDANNNGEVKIQEETTTTVVYKIPEKSNN